MRKILLAFILILLCNICLNSCICFKQLDNKFRIRATLEEFRRTSFIRSLYLKADTIYCYEQSFKKNDIIWFHKNGYIHYYIEQPLGFKKRKPIKSENLTINSESFEEIVNFRNSFNGMIPDRRGPKCFEDALDGDELLIFIRGRKDYYYLSIDIRCLFSHIFPKNSFPAKIKNDLSLIKEYTSF